VNTNASGDQGAQGAKGATAEPASWRELAVARSLDSARSRAESRVQRFLDAAIELMNNGSTKEFTVQEVVERSGQSLRSFYQYFGGKHELLLALFEESVRSTADHLRARVADLEPGERLHCFVTEYYKMCRPAPKGKTTKKDAKRIEPSPVLVEFAQQLLTAHPTEAARAFVPIVALFEEILDGAAEAGVIRADVRRRQVAGVVLESIMFNAFSATISGSSLHEDGAAAAEELWDLLFHGLHAS
jgi:AcrR family transcriptional regulator